MSKTPAEKLLIGVHTSAEGGVHNALLHGKKIGATTIQLFTSNQRQWKGKPIPTEVVKLWEDAIKETGIQKVMSHGSYLINLGAKDPDVLKKSQIAFKEELERCHQLKLSFLNFHPGSATKRTEEECLECIVKSINDLEPIISKGSTRLLIENTAGQGSNVGYDFAHLAYIIDHVKKKIPIGVCIDTCHAFAAGYDLRDKSSFEKTFKEFDQVVGFKYLYAFHVNDSVKPFESHRDRHAQLGEGKLGLECFKILMTHPKLRELPKYLETRDPKKWPKEISLLRKFAK